jgi:hypothetical protein
LIRISRPTSLSCAPIIAAILACGILLQAEDIKLREQAVQFLEMANAVSLPGALRNYEQTVTFRFHEPDGTVKEGTYSRFSSGASGFREEVTFGVHHTVTVVSGDRISDTRTTNDPPEVRALRRELPVHLARFDHEDTIRSIEEAAVSGLPAKCIHFDTQFGNTVQANQICLDSERGVIVRWEVGDELIESSDYFRVANLWEPGHIRRYLRGALQIEIEQHMEAIQGPVDPNVFSPPSNKWNQLYPCKNMRRAIGTSTPMPPPGNAGTEIVDVIVHGFIWNDGSVRLTQIESSPRLDLNEEALKTVATWKFLPLMCNDRVASTDADFVVHFQGR